MDKSGWQEVEYKANLFLQIFLFFNVYFSPLWAVFFIYNLCYNTASFGKIQFILAIFAFVLTIPAEIFRLYLGYSGNLKAKVSDLSGFWILTTLIQLPIHSFFALTINDAIILSYLQYIMLGFIVIEIPFGTFASRKLTKYQAQLYQINFIAKMQRKKY